MKRALSASLMFVLLASQQSFISAAEEAEFRARPSAKKPQSLKSADPSKFCTQNILKVNSTIDPESAYIYLFSPGDSTVETFKCAKPTKNDTVEWVKDLKVIRDTTVAYGANLKFDKKYDGCRKAVLGKLLESILMVKKEYDGNPLADKYINYPIWSVTLHNKEELEEFTSQLNKRLIKKYCTKNDSSEMTEEPVEENSQVQTTSTPILEVPKPVLLLRLADDPYLQTLTEEDLQSLANLFDVTHYNDLETTYFVNKKLKDLDKILMKMQLTRPSQLGENLRERLLRELESLCDDFEMDKMSKKLIIATVGLTLLVYKDDIRKLITENSPIKALFTKLKLI